MKKKSADKDLHWHYIGRWKKINAFQNEELRRLTPEECLRHFFYLMNLAKAMNWETSPPEEVEEVRRRWKKIKGYGG